MKKKIVIIVSIAIVVAMVIGLGLYFKLRSDFIYEVNEEHTVTITGYRGEDTEIVIPQMLGGKTVTRIGNGSFMDHEEMVSLHIPECVEIIGEYAFESCSNLVTVTGGEGIKEIKEQAFSACKKLENITLHEGLEIIGWWAFSATNITEVNIPSTVREIQHGAFSVARNLVKVSIPESVQVIGKMAFDQTEWLESFAEEDTLIVGDGIMLKYPINQEIVVIPKGVNVINTRDWHNEILEEVYVSNTTTKIFEDMFGDHGEITLYIPSSVQQIGGFDNPEDTDISYDDMTKITLVVEAGSYAEEYAKLKSEETGLKYRIVDEINYPVQ